MPNNTQDPRVLDAMLPYMVDMYGNPHSRTHAYGWESSDAVEKAREVYAWMCYSVCMFVCVWCVCVFARVCVCFFCFVL